MDEARVIERAQERPITIRPLRNDDWEGWIDLRLSLWPHHDRSDLETEARGIAGTLSTTPVFVAVDPHGRLVGLLEASIRCKAPGCATRRIGYIEGWFVAPEWRRQGVGGRLVREAERWARAQGCTEMASDTTDRYPESPASHAALGYQPVRTEIYFRKHLNQETS